MSSPYFQDSTVTVYCGDAISVLRELEPESVRCCVTSPPYWGLRDYGHPGQIGLESTPEEYVSSLVTVFREVRRVLRSDGTLWLNLGDSYAHGGNGSRDPERWPKQSRNDHRVEHAKKLGDLKPKDLVGIPWRVAFALQSAGWYLRSDIIWAKPNPMPESVSDRPTKSHEYMFLLSKSERYFYDAEAIREPATDVGRVNGHNGRDEDPRTRPPGSNPRTLARLDWTERGRNKRSVWTVALHPYSGAHFATFPPELIRPCLLAGTEEGDLVLDPFGGSGTTCWLARSLGRRAVSIEVNPEYCGLHVRRLRQSVLAFPPVSSTQKPDLRVQGYEG